MDEATGLVFSLFDVASSRNMLFALCQLQYVQYTHLRLPFVLQLGVGFVIAWYIQLPSRYTCFILFTHIFCTDCSYSSLLYCVTLCRGWSIAKNKAPHFQLIVDFGVCIETQISLLFTTKLLTIMKPHYFLKIRSYFNLAKPIDSTSFLKKIAKLCWVNWTRWSFGTFSSVHWCISKDWIVPLANNWCNVTLVHQGGDADTDTTYLQAHL